MKLSPTNLEVFLNKKNDGLFLGTYLEYELNFDINPYIKEAIIKETKVGFDGEVKTVKHFYNYSEDNYCYMFNEGHTLQSLFELNNIDFDENVEYFLYNNINI